MALRIAEIYRVLKPTGSFYLHCDPSASHYLKIIIDSIFCARNGEFLNEIIWKRTAAHSSSKKYGPVHDVILFYSKSPNFTWNKLYQPYDQDYLETFFDEVDEKGKKYQRVDLTGAGTTNGESGKPWRGLNVFSKGRHWAYNHKQLEEWDKQGKIHWPKKEGGMPRLKVYPEDKKGVVLQDIWTDIKPLHNLAAERLGYPTQKPESLLERIIKASTNEGDVVLDAYCGCGTSVAVAERLNRQWIGMDITYHSISLILKRMEEHFGASTIKNISLNGVPEDFKSAEALANKKDDRTRKEFEKWAVLTYSNNRASINEKKGSDGGIDGVSYMLDLNGKKQDHKQIIFSVKSNKVLSPTVIRDLNGTLEREGAALGILITLYPMDNLIKESKKYGTYNNSILGQNYPKIDVITVDDILAGKTMKIPTSLEVLKEAERRTKDKQGKFEF
jgi:DNA modification methylase